MLLQKMRMYLKLIQKEGSLRRQLRRLDIPDPSPVRGPYRKIKYSKKRDGKKEKQIPPQEHGQEIQIEVHAESPIQIDGVDRKKMPSNDTKPKSVRKPLKDLSNNGNGGGKFSKSVNGKKKLNEEQSDDGSLDRLLLVQSDLSTLLQQVHSNSLFGTCTYTPVFP